METCDVLIVGGGPAGSTCAASLVRSGLDVVVADKASFPRDKTCAGWITPAVVEELGLDLDRYAQGRTLDPIRGFRVGRIGDRIHEVRYDRPMSYGIRRCEFDHYLLASCGARVVEGVRVERIERVRDRWIVGERNETGRRIGARVLVGAGGHFCPVARALGGGDGAPVVAAEEVEFALEDDDVGGSPIEAGTPELYYTADLAGYGWAFRKDRYLNIGLGARAKAGDARTGGSRLRERIDEFLAYLRREGRIAREPRKKMSGHAYLLRNDSRRRAAGDGYLLVGDAAGLAYDRSGEGIRPAVESAMLAAASIRRAFGGADPGSSSFEEYREALAKRFDDGMDPAAALPKPIAVALAAALMRSAWFSRRFLLERWFLHTHQQPLRA